jgi:hypothetical protein
MTQVVSQQPLIPDATFQSRASWHAIFGGESDNRLGFPLSSSAFPCQCNSTSTLYTYHRCFIPLTISHRVKQHAYESNIRIVYLLFLKKGWMHSLFSEIGYWRKSRILNKK